MISRQDLQNLSTGGQMLSDIDPDIIKEWIEVIRAADVTRWCEYSHFMVFTELDHALQMHKDLHPNSPLVEVRYYRLTQVFGIIIDKVGREIISLTMDDLKLLADMPID